MFSATIHYRNWVITSTVRTLEPKDGLIIYEATALLENFIDPTEDRKQAERAENLRRIYGARGDFENESLAKDAAVAAAKRAIDSIYA